MDSTLELLVVLGIVLVPIVPASVLLAATLRQRRQGRSEAAEVISGRAPETPFVAIAVLATAIACVAGVAVAITVLARQLA